VKYIRHHLKCDSSLYSIICFFYKFTNNSIQYYIIYIILFLLYWTVWRNTFKFYFSLNYMPVLSSGNLPSTPFYPPVLPYDMFSDIIRDINANTESSPEQNQTQTIVAGISSQQVTSTFQTSSPKTQLCSSPGLPLQISPLPDSVSPCHITPPLQDSPSSHSCVLNTSSDTSSSSQQTTPPLSCQQVPSAYDHHDFRSYYINYTFPLHCFQSSMNQCMYRR
jgi:hypothetical protein